MNSNKMVYFLYWLFSCLLEKPSVSSFSLWILYFWRSLVSWIFWVILGDNHDGVHVCLISSYDAIYLCWQEGKRRTPYLQMLFEQHYAWQYLLWQDGTKDSFLFFILLLRDDKQCLSQVRLYGWRFATIIPMSIVRW